MPQTTAIPVPVTVSRHSPGWEQLRGDSIDWKIGEKAIAVGEQSGAQHRVEIASALCGNAAVPGVACYDVLFLDEGRARHCIAAHILRHPLWAGATVQHD